MHEPKPIPKTKIALSVLAAIALVVVFSAAGWAWLYYTAEVRGVVSAEEQIESAPSRISNYNHFFELCASVQRKESKIASQRSLLETATSDEERARIRRNVAALEGARAGDIHRYNADAAKQYTAARFRASSLPARLDADAESTTCSL